MRDFWRLEARGNSVKRELAGGVTTFFAMGSVRKIP